MEKRKGVFSFCNLKHRQFVATGLMVILLIGTTPQSLWANPLGEAIKAGNATFTRDGNNLIIKQGSDRMVVNWRSFSIGKGELTKFIQPGAKSSALNRVLGGTRSLIDGRLEANGQVVLVNPNGITVGANGVVNVNSFIGSTLDITDENFMAGGDLKFSGDSEADVTNLGTIKAETGDVFLLAKTINNEGTIEAPNGTVGLGAGSEIVIQPDAAEKLYIAPSSKKGGSITNKGAIRAAAAEIKAAGNPYALAINLEGVVDVKGSSSKPAGTVKIDGGQGNIKIAKDATIKARNADNSGGTIAINGKADGSKPKFDELGDVEIAGSLDAAGANGKILAFGNKLTVASGSALLTGTSTAGGFIETSGNKVKVAGSVLAGTGGKWLLDPTNVTIDDALATSIATALAAGTDSDIQADNDITVAANITAGGAGNLFLRSDYNADGMGTVSFGSGIKITRTGGSGNVNLYYNPPGGYGTPTVYTSNVTMGTGIFRAYMLVNTAADLQSINASANARKGVYAQNKNIDLASIANFTPIGRDSSNAFSGVYDGQGYTISNLTISTTNYNVGLFGYVNFQGKITRVGIKNVDITTKTYANVGSLVGDLEGGSVTDSYAVDEDANPDIKMSEQSWAGGLVGANTGGTISRSYANIQLSSSRGGTIGGLVGANGGTGSYGTIDESYALGDVSGKPSSADDRDGLGGLVGFNNATITQSYSRGKVTDTSFVASSVRVGGFVGSNHASGRISESYSTGQVVSTPGGGFAGENVSGATITNSYWDTQTSGKSTSAGGASVVGLTTAQMKGQADAPYNGLLPNFDSAIWKLRSSRNDGYPYLWWQYPPVAVTVSGNVAGLSSGQVSLAINGEVVGSPVSLDANGNFTFNLTNENSTGDAVIWLNSGGSANGYMTLAGVNTTGFDLMSNWVWVHDSQSSATVSSAITNLGTAKGSLSSGMLYSVSSGLLSLNDDISLRLDTTSTGLSIDSALSTTADLKLTAAGAITNTSAGSLNVGGIATVDAGAGNISLGGKGVGSINVNRFNLKGAEVAVSAVGDSGFSGASVIGSLAFTTTGRITLDAGSSISASGGGTSINLVGKGFTNSSGSAALQTPAGRWLVWSDDPSKDNRGGLTYIFKQYDAVYDRATVQGSGNGFLYAIAPTITPSVTGAISKIYDGTNSATASNGNLSSSGAIDGDSVTLSFGGSASYNNPDAGTAKDVTLDGISLVGATNGAVVVYGYRLGSSSATGTVGIITPADVIVTALGGTSIYGDSPTNPGLSAVGLVAGQNVSVLTGLSNSFGITSSSDANTYALSVQGTLTNANYNITSTNGGSWIVTPKSIIVQAVGGKSVYGDSPANPGVTSTGLVNGQDGSVLTGLTNSFSIDNLTDAGSHTLSVKGTLTNGNYIVASTLNGTWVVDKKGLVATALGGSSIYGDSPSDPGLSISGFVNGQNASVISGLSNSFGISNTSNADNYVLTVVGTLVADNYTLEATVNGKWIVGKKGVVVTALGGNSTYGDSPLDPGLSATGLVNGQTVADLTGLSNSFDITNLTGAGNHALTVAGTLTNGNYEVASTINGLWTVNAKDITVSANSGTSIYGDSPANPGLTAIGLVNGQDVSVLTGLSNSFGITSFSDAKTYALSVQGALTNANYNVTSTSGGSWIVAPKSIVVQAVGGNSVYGDSPVNPGVTSKGLVNGQDGSVLTGLTNSFGIDNLTNADSYTLTVQGVLTNENYVVASTLDGKWTVDKKGLVAAALGGNSIYGDSPSDPGLSVTGFVNGQNASVISGLSNSFGITNTTNAGDHILTVVGNLVADNYTLASTVDGTWVVGKKGVVVTALGGISIYGESPVDPGLSATGLVNGQTVADLTGLSNSFGITSTTGAGDKALTVAGSLTNGNYLVAGTMNGLWVVSPKDIVVTALGGKSTYGESPVNPGLSATGLVNGQTAAVLTGLSNSFGITNLTDVNEYTLMVDGLLTNGNYRVASRVDGNWTVGKKDIVVTALGGASIYGDSPINPGLSATGLVNDQTVAVLSGLSNSFGITNLSNAESYVLKVDGVLSNGNYNVVSTVNGAWIVGKKGVSVTALGGNSTYGDSPADPGLSATGLVNGQTVADLTGLSNSFGITNLSDAGDYLLKVSGKLTNGNYQVETTTNGLWQVASKGVIVTALGGVSIYGDSPANPGLSATGLVNGQNVAALTGLSNSFAITNLTNAGDYALAVLGELMNKNYHVIERTGGLWQVEKKSVTVTALGGISIYGESPANPGLSAEGLVNEQTVAALTGLSNSFGITNLSDAGDYLLKVSGELTNGNYRVIATNDGVWQVQKKDITVAALGGRSTYGENPADPGFTADGLVNDQTVAVLTGLSNSFGINNLTDAGKHTLEVVGELTNGNYRIVRKEENGWIVMAKRVEVTANSGTSIYGDSPAIPGFTATGLVNDQTTEVLTGLQGAFKVNDYTPVGNGYETWVDGELTNGNYFVSVRNSGEWNVTPAPLTIAADNQTKIYGTDFEFNGTEYTATGLVNGETIGLLKMASEGAPATATVAGSPYEIWIQRYKPDKGLLPEGKAPEGRGFNPRNYDITYVDGKFTVTKAPLTVRANGGQSDQGQSPTNPGVTLVGGSLFNGDTLASLKLINSFGINSGTAAGQYLLSVLGDPSNYAITMVTGEWVVNALPVTNEVPEKVKGQQLSQPPPESVELPATTFIGSSSFESGLDTQGPVSVEIEGFDSMFASMGLDPDQGTAQVSGWSDQLDPNKEKKEE